MDIHEVAGQAYEAFQVIRRGEDSIVTLREDAPDWVKDLTYYAHGEFGPDDWRYEAIRDACSYVFDSGAVDVMDAEDLTHEFADSHVDVYTGARLQWLASNLNRPAYVDEARDEGLVSGDQDITEQVGVGQYMELAEVFRLVIEKLAERIDDDGDDSIEGSEEWEGAHDGN